MFGLTLTQVLERLVAIVVLSGINGFLVALAAQLMGDRGPTYDGKRSINPFKHLDPLAVISAILFQIGWILPIAIDTKLLRGRWLGAFAVAVGSLAAMLAFAALVAMLRAPVLTIVTDPSMASIAANILRTIVELSVWFVLFNLIPLPPLSGGIVLRAIAPDAVRWLDRYSLIVRIGLVVVLASGLPQLALRPMYNAILAAAG